MVAENLGQLVSDSFITPKYLSHMIEEIADLVSDKGIVQLTDLTDKYWLPLTFIRELITSRMASFP